MGDQDFDFRPPPRREARRFEPPPWEKEAFDKFAQEEAAQRQTTAEAAELTGPVEPAGPVESSEHDRGEPAPTPKAELDEKQVSMMMLELRAEEPVALRGAWLVNAASGAIVALVGLGITIWGIAALAGAKTSGFALLASGLLVAFGLGFVGLGGWLVFKALRQRGVL